MKKIACILLSLICAVSMAAADAGADQSKSGSANPHEAAWLGEEMDETLDSIKRVDENGAFYEMNYTADYYEASMMSLAEGVAKALTTGCSAFTVYNNNRQFLFCRNYDYRHKDAEGNSTGLNVFIRFAPEGKLKSVGICDAFWLNPHGFYAGSLDDGKTDISNMALVPYACVDGMNEAGLTAALLVADIKEGETPTNQNTGKKEVTHSMLLRHIMDNAHNIDEAIEIAKSYDVYSNGGADLRMFISQKDGVSAVFEWRQYGDDEQQELHITYTNAVTNFYVGFDDGQDVCGADGTLKESCAKIAPPSTTTATATAMDTIALTRSSPRWSGISSRRITARASGTA